MGEMALTAVVMAGRDLRRRALEPRASSSVSAATLVGSVVGQAHRCPGRTVHSVGRGVNKMFMRASSDSPLQFPNEKQIIKSTSFSIAATRTIFSAAHLQVPPPRAWRMLAPLRLIRTARLFSQPLHLPLRTCPIATLHTMSTAQLRKKTAKQYDQALAAGDAFYFPSQVHVLTQAANPQAAADQTHAPADAKPEEREIKTLDVDFVVRSVPALLKKPTPNAVKPAEKQPQQNKEDPFAPPYVPNLLISEQEPEGGVVLLNKFCVVPRHMLLVSRDFAPQNLPPPPELLAQAYRILAGFRGDPTEEEMMAFYNCGWESGASQKHCHLQLIEVRREEMLPEGVDPDEHPAPDDAEGVIPIERLLTSIERDGSEFRMLTSRFDK